MVKNFLKSTPKLEEKENLCSNSLNLTRNEITILIDRVKAKTLFDLNYSASEVQKHLKPRSYSTQTLYSWKNLNWNVEALIPKKSTGRKPIITKQIENKIFHLATKKKFSTRTISKSLPKKVSHEQVKKILHKQGLRAYRSRLVGKLNDSHIDDRLKFAKLYKQKPLSYWESLLITDSKIFLLNRGRNSQNDKTWCFSPEEAEIHEIEKFEQSVHVYGGMSSLGLTELIFVNGTINAEKYVGNILPRLTINHQHRKKTIGSVTEIKMFENPKKFIFEQDHASSHDSNVAQEWCSNNLPEFLDKNATPAKLDDVWPIERLWAILTANVYKDPYPKTILALKRRLRKCWSEISQSTLLKLVHQIPLRLNEIEQRNGQKIVDFKGHCLCQRCSETRQHN